MNTKNKQRLTAAVEEIATIIQNIYGEDARFSISPEGVDIDDTNSVVLESACTPARAIERLCEDGA